VKETRESLAVALGALTVTLLALRVDARWLEGVLGDQDAWQNLWNLHHVDRALRTGSPLFFTHRLWAPEGTSLLAHTLSLTNSLPGALLARLVGFFAAYNALVAGSFVLAAVALYGLARRLGASPVGAAFGAAVFAFNPQRFARSLGHLNLLGIGWLAVALAALVLAAKRRGAPRLFAGAAAGLAFTALAFTDLYLAILGGIAVASLFVFQLAREADKRGVLAAYSAAALVAAPCVLPYALAVRKETAGWKTSGHESQWCSTAVTSLVIPGPVQLASRLTRPLTERNHQNNTEGASYLGLVPLAATVWMAVGRRRVRALDPFLLAGAAGLLLALGPKLRIFDRLLEVPLPYALVERLVPALRLGGCVNRFVALASLPLALGTAFAATRLLAARTASGRAIVAAGALFYAVEVAPVNPGVAVWPYTPADPAMVAIANAPETGNVFDVDGGAAALIRQLRHGRPQVLGYVSRTPPAGLARRLDDPVVGPLLTEDRARIPVPPAASAALLRDRWNVAFVVSPDVEPYRSRARSLGFPLFAATPGLSLVWRVPDEPLPPLNELAVADTADPARAPSGGAFGWGFGPATTLDAGGGSYAGRWAGADSGLLVPLAAGRYALLAAAISPARVVARWGRAHELARTVSAPAALELDVTPDDLAGDGTLLVSLHAEPFASPPGQALFVASLKKLD
jgi:hypothetical protein